MSVRSSASESSLTHPSKWSHSTRRLPGLRERARVGRSCLPAAQRASRGKGSLSALAGRMGPSATGRSAPRRAARPPPCHGEGSATTPLPNVCLVGIPLGRRLPAPLPDVCLVGIWDADFRPLSRISASSGFGTPTFGSSPLLMPRRDSSGTPTPSLSHWTPRRGHPIRGLVAHDSPHAFPVPDSGRPRRAN